MRPVEAGSHVRPRSVRVGGVEVVEALVWRGGVADAALLHFVQLTKP